MKYQRGFIWSVCFILCVVLLASPLQFHLQNAVTTLGALLQVLVNTQQPIFRTWQVWVGVGQISFILVLLLMTLYASWVLFGSKLLGKDGKFVAKISGWWLGIFLCYSVFFFLLRLRFAVFDKVIQGSSAEIAVVDLVDSVVLLVLLFFFTQSFSSRTLFRKPTWRSVGYFVLFCFVFLVFDALVKFISLYSVFVAQSLGVLLFVLLFHVYWIFMQKVFDSQFADSDTGSKRGVKHA